MQFRKLTLITFSTVTLLNIPGFIERLCKLATRKVSEATGANFLQELEDWYTWLDNALVLDTLMQMATEEAEQSSTGESLGTSNSPYFNRVFRALTVFLPSESSDESSVATSPLQHRLPQSMKIVHEIMYKLEVLYVLCVLLMGRQRNQVPRNSPSSLFQTVNGGNRVFYSPFVLSHCRSTKCWPSSVSSQDSTTCLTS